MNKSATGSTITPPIRLPIRVAHPPRPELEHLNDRYFEFLCGCGYEALYLQDSPFDSYTGNHGSFKKLFHLIYLYDIAYGPQNERYRDYINEVCRRAARHGLKTYLCCWEPRLPYSAWGETPPSWRGWGGFAYAGHNHTSSFCWSEPDAVAYWKSMAYTAFAALPDISGVHLGVVDNEASFCNEDCPKCKGQTMSRQLEDIYQTFAEIKRSRPDFRIAIYDWWLPNDLLARLPTIVGHDALVIGRSSQGHQQPPLPGSVEDMTAIFSECGPSILDQKKRADNIGLRLVDMPAWSHPNEAFWLPAMPDPLYAIEKLRALDKLGAAGWYDFDCGATEPGSVADAIIAWTQNPERSDDALMKEVLCDIHGTDWEQAAPAYEQFRLGKKHFPVAYNDPVVQGFSGRSPGLSNTLIGPFLLEDFRFRDLGHSFLWAAPYNFVTESTLPVVLPRLETVTHHMRQAFEIISDLPSESRRATRERDAFEIYYRHYRAIWNYYRLGQAKLDWIMHRSNTPAFVQTVRSIAADETENLVATEAWLERNPGKLSNPCHSLIGWMEECWPRQSFTLDLFAPKRESLRLLNNVTSQQVRRAAR